MKEYPKVLVVTRTLVRSPFLERAIQSVASQTFSDYVHVIVNDGGDKDTLDNIVSSLEEPVAEKMKIFHRKESSNAPDTIFNESIDRVDSEYFAIHDDDDTWHPEFLQQTVDHLDKSKELGAVVVRTDKVIELVEGQSIQESKRAQWMPDVKAINLYRQCIDNQFTPIATLFRRSAYEDVGKFDSSLPVVGDWEFGVRLLQKYDADFLDPGYALANYHHRKLKNGKMGHVSSHKKHRYYTNKVMNKYLREELANGQLGVGYMMSQLKYNQTNTSNMLKKFLPNSIVEKLKKKVSN